MTQIYNMREMVDELAKLVGREEAGSLGVQQVFAPFQGLQALQVWLYRVGVCGRAQQARAILSRRERY